MLHIFIGGIVGFVMGLTGSGGALIALPLFIFLLNTTNKESTILSLIAVSLGTLINLKGQVKKVNYRICGNLAFFGALGSYLALLFKNDLPDSVTIILLAAIGLFGLWSVWKKEEEMDLKKNQGAERIKLAVIGVALGIVTGLTGLGGGVLLIPILINWFNMNYEEAIPTSLGTIFLVSLLTFGLQFNEAMGLIDPKGIGLLSIGVLVAYFLLNLFLTGVDKNKIKMARKIVFTLVTLYSIGAMLFNQFKAFV